MNKKQGKRQTTAPTHTINTSYLPRILPHAIHNTLTQKKPYKKGLKLAEKAEREGKTSSEDKNTKTKFSGIAT